MLEAHFHEIAYGVVAALSLLVIFLLARLRRASVELARTRQAGIDAAVRLIEGLPIDREIKRIVFDALEKLYRADTPVAQVRQAKVDDIFEQAQRRLDPPQSPR